MEQQQPIQKNLWQCKTYVLEGKAACDAEAVGESILQDAFVRMFNRLKENKSSFIQIVYAVIERAQSESNDHKSIVELEEIIEQ